MACSIAGETFSFSTSWRRFSTACLDVFFSCETAGVEARNPARRRRGNARRFIHCLLRRRKGVRTIVRGAGQAQARGAPCSNANNPRNEMTCKACGGKLMPDRRGFLSSLRAVAATAALPITKIYDDLAHQSLVPMPAAALYDKDEEAYWTAIRKQFLIPEDEAYLNNGTVGSSPMPVLKAIIDCHQDAERLAQNDPEDYPIWGYAAWNQFRDPLAAFVGCKRDEIALVRNATEANSYIANGVDLKAGDEVLITDQEHPGGEHPWDLRAKRYGIAIKKITLPKPVPDAG